MWKWIVILLVLLIGTCVGSGWYLQSSGQLQKLREQFQPDLKATPVRLGTVAKGDLVRTVSAPGQVEPRTKVEISAQVSARIIALPFREGDRIKKGDVVARLDAPHDLAALLQSAQAQLKSEEARLSGAKAAFENAAAERQRRLDLLNSKDISPSEMDQFETEFLRAESTLKMSEHAIDIARANIVRAEKDLDNTLITSPFDGIITKLDAEIGELVVVGTLNNPGSVFMEIADLTVMIVKARVDEANIAPIQNGQKSRVYVNAYPDIVFKGTVDHVGLKRELDRDGTAFFETEILLELPEGIMLRSGLTANADIEVETFRDVVKIPSQAVVDRPIEELPTDVVAGSAHVDRAKKFARVVYAFKDGMTRVLPVDVGTSDLTDTMIMGGLEAGETIVIGPYKALAALKHEQRVVDETTIEKKKDAKTAVKTGGNGPT